MKYPLIEGKPVFRFNPYTGQARDARDIESDPYGVLIVPPKYPLDKFSVRGMDEKYRLMAYRGRK
jgi:hypothetical protein